jgi:Holliday junction resolvase
MKESEIQYKIINFLKKEGWFVVKIIRANITGISDIICFKNGVSVFVEVKNEIGKQSEVQKYVQKQIEQQGFKYILARSIEDIKNHFVEINNMVYKI